MKKSEEEADCILSPIQPDIVLPISQDISQVKGIVFEDNNANGIKDIGEEGLANILVSNGLTVTVTDETGSYLLPTYLLFFRSGLISLCRLRSQRIFRW